MNDDILNNRRHPYWRTSGEPVTQSPILRTPATEPILSELDQIHEALPMTHNPTDRIRLRNRQGELTQQYWRIYHSRQRGTT